MLKETETVETIDFFVTFLSLVSFQLGGTLAPCPPSLATPMVFLYLFFSLEKKAAKDLKICKGSLVNKKKFWEPLVGSLVESYVRDIFLCLL